MTKENYIVSSLRALRYFGRSNQEIQEMDCHVGLCPPRNDGESVLALARMTVNQKGNALFFILIAIALLGLLTVTMTRSGDSTNNTGSYEQNQIAASEILSYAKSIENAVQSLLARGCSENELSFWHDSNGDGTEAASDDYYNATSPSDHSCHVFDAAGAGLIFLENTAFFPNGTWAQPYNDFIGKSDIMGVGTNNTNRSQELIWVFELPQNIDEIAFCNAFNKQGGNDINTIPSSSIWAAPSFKGSFDPNAYVPTPELDGVLTACYNYSVDTDRYLLYHVLIAR